MADVPQAHERGEVLFERTGTFEPRGPDTISEIAPPPRQRPREDEPIELVEEHAHTD
jgi:hypothetical protein